MSEELALDALPGAEPEQEAAPEKDASAKAPAKTDWWGEVKGIVWLVLAVLGFHSFIAKPFYIPSESMLPGLEVGDQLIVTKYAYGWSFVSPTIPNPVAIFRSLVLRQQVESWGVQLPFVHGRLFGHMPERGDVVIVTPPGRNTDYIKRVIGLPGDRLQVIDGTVYLNGTPVKRGPLHYIDLPNYGGVPMPGENALTCDPDQYRGQPLLRNADGTTTCHLPLVTETLPNGRHYENGRARPKRRRQLSADRNSARPCLPDGRQSRSQRRQPLPGRADGPGRPHSLGESGRSCRVRHLLEDRQRQLEPLHLGAELPLRAGGHLAARRAR